MFLVGLSLSGNILLGNENLRDRCFLKSKAKTVCFASSAFMKYAVFHLRGTKTARVRTAKCLFF